MAILSAKQRRSVKVVLPEHFASLSHDAKGVGGVWFGMMRPDGNSSLTFHLEKSRPSARSQAALDELYRAKLISKQPFNRFGGVVYRPLVDFHPLFQWMLKHGEDPKLKFTLTEPMGA